MCHMMFEASRGIHWDRNAFGTVLEIKGRVVIGNWRSCSLWWRPESKGKIGLAWGDSGKTYSSCVRAASLALNMESSLSGATGERMRSQQECKGLCGGS